MTALDWSSIAGRMVRKIEGCCGCNWAADLTDPERRAVEEAAAAGETEATAPREYGGRAICPADEWDDLELREEMLWHAIEGALTDAGWPEAMRNVDVEWSRFTGLVSQLAVGTELRPSIKIFGCPLILSAATDDHLGEDVSTVDLTARLVEV